MCIEGFPYSSSISIPAESLNTANNIFSIAAMTNTRKKAETKTQQEKKACLMKLRHDVEAGD